MPKKLIYGVSAVVLSVVLYNTCVEFIEPTERGGKRVMSEVVSTTPLLPGRYLTIPFISQVDVLQTSLQTVHVQPFTVQTVDNQRITLDINLSYTIPDSAVLHLLYEVGRSGSGDIRANIEPIVRDRVSRVFASKNTNYLSRDRVEIQNEVTGVVHEEMNKLFRINVESLQIASITYSDAFVTSNDQAVLEKNRAVQAQNKVITIELEAKQRVAEAEGQAKQQVVAAEAEAKKVELAAKASAASITLRAKADADATILQATADRQARELRGVGEGAALQAIVGALGGSDKYVAMLNAQALAKWSGQYPNTIINGGGGAGTQMPLILPMGALGPQAAK